MSRNILCLCIILGCGVTVYTFREFNTLPTPKATRRTSYNPTVLAKTCYLIPDPGPCRGYVPMYYFNSTTMTCSNVFRWGGCQGNGNRFDSIEECEGYCLSPPNYRRGRPEYCSLTFDYGFCFGAVERWYYDPLWKVCKKGLYSGCGGNKNNFPIQEQCIQVCSFGKPSLAFSTKHDWKGVKKVLIINPFDATTKHVHDPKKKGTNKTTPIPYSSSRITSLPPLDESQNFDIHQKSRSNSTLLGPKKAINL